MNVQQNNVLTTLKNTWWNKDAIEDNKWLMWIIETFNNLIVPLEAVLCIKMSNMENVQQEDVLYTKKQCVVWEKEVIVIEVDLMIVIEQNYIEENIIITITIE